VSVLHYFSEYDFSKCPSLKEFSNKANAYFIYVAHTCACPSVLRREATMRGSKTFAGAKVLLFFDICKKKSEKSLFFGLLALCAG